MKEYKTIEWPGTCGSETATLVILSEEIEEVIKIVNSLEGSELLLKGVCKTVDNKTKEERDDFFSILLGALCAIIPLEILLSGRDVIPMMSNQSWRCQLQ